VARYTEAVCRQCRREGEKLYLKGDRCYSEKCAVEKRPYPPGQHGNGRGRVRKRTDDAAQVIENQKAKRIYGVLERQFRNYFEKAERMQGVTGENLLILLERRLDNVVYRMGYGASRKEARQLVNHGHFTINGRKATIPSMLVKIGDVVEVKEKSRESLKFKDLQAQAGFKSAPDWLEVDVENLRGRVVAYPKREEIDATIAEHLIVELYSR